MRTNTFLTAAATVAGLFAGQVFAQSETPNNATMPVSFYYTRPQSQAPAFNVSIQQGFSPGYVFIAPYQAVHPGPYIYDKFGNLVFDGYGVLGSANAHNFHVCSYNGSDHLCFNQMNQQLGYGVGQGLIVDDNYRVVKQINIGSSAGNVDMHEFQLVNGGESALLSSYQAIPYDLSAFNITSGLGWLLQGVFQEVNVTTGEVVFEWFSSNHVDPSETDITPNTTDVSGTGFMPSTAFDYFHINAIDKSTQSGNYLVSARHISTVYYINATDGNIVWRLSHFGQSDFDVKGFNFSFQHDARLVSENSTTTVISIFDNASNGYNNSNTQSSGMLISIDHPSKTATLVEQWHMPRKGGVLSSSQGNTQLLPDGGAFIGWGNWAYATEFNASGDAVWHVQFASSSTMNYRAFSFNWTSTPSTTVPDVYSYASNNNNASNHVYVSWNGATTVSRWNFYGAQSPTTDSVTLVGSADKAGFETQWTSSKYYSWWMVEAVAADGTALRNSSFQRTFIPGQALLASACDDMGCQAASSYDTAQAAIGAIDPSTDETISKSSSASGSSSSATASSGAKKSSAAAELRPQHSIFALWIGVLSICIFSL